jgi:hypothetical protein
MMYVRTSGGSTGLQPGESGPSSVYDGVYDAITVAIERMSREMFR